MAFERQPVRFGLAAMLGDFALVLQPCSLGRFDGALVGRSRARKLLLGTGKGRLSLGVLLFGATMLVEDAGVERLHLLPAFLVQPARRGRRGTRRGRTGWDRTSWGRISGRVSCGDSRDGRRACASRTRRACGARLLGTRDWIGRCSPPRLRAANGVATKSALSRAKAGTLGPGRRCGDHHAGQPEDDHARH